MAQYYECHITMSGDPLELRKSVESVGWKFSKIDGDPVLGEGVKCYATKHFSIHATKEQVIDHIEATTLLLPDVIRAKVELVIYDNYGAVQ